MQLTSLRNLTESFAKNVHAIARGRFATGGVVDELPSNICYIIHIGKILTMLYKENPEEHKFCIRSDSAFPAAAASESAFTKLSFLTTGGSRICGKGGRSGYRERRRREGFWRVPFEDPLWNFKRGARAPCAPPLNPLVLTHPFSTMKRSNILIADSFACLGVFCYPYRPRLTAELCSFVGLIGLKPWTVRFCHNST